MLTESSRLQNVLNLNSESGMRDAGLLAPHLLIFVILIDFFFKRRLLHYSQCFEDKNVYIPSSDIVLTCVSNDLSHLI